MIKAVLNKDCFFLNIFLNKLFINKNIWQEKLK